MPPAATIPARPAARARTGPTFPAATARPAATRADPGRPGGYQAGYGPDNAGYGPDNGAGYGPGYGPGNGVGQPGRYAAPRRSRGLLIAGIVVAVAVVAAGVTVGLLLTHSPKHNSAAPPAGGASAPASQGASTGNSSPSAPASSPAASGSAQQQAATRLAALLASSVSDRAAIDDAYNDVMSCGPTLSQDAGTFQQAVTSRQQLLSQLNGMPGASALPASMISSLSQAWQASISADQDFAAWAQDESGSCTPNDTADANYQAANGPDSQATTFKTAFVGQWNPIATQYSLQTYQQDQL